MAIGVRDSEERVTGGLKLMTGANFVYVKAISPTVEEMKSVLGFDEPKAPTPSVDTDVEGNTRVRLDFWLSRPEDEFLYRESFFITKKDVTSQSGKVQFVNNFAQFCYADPNEDLSMSGSARKVCVELSTVKRHLSTSSVHG
jgi:hypothetical protein